MLMTLSFSCSTRLPEENTVNIGNWTLEDTSASSVDPKHERYYYSKLDSHLTCKTHIRISPGELTLERNGSAEIPLFYFISSDKVFISDSVYELQECIKQPLDLDSAYQYLYSQFLPKENTLFRGVIQVLNNQKIRFSRSESTIVRHITDRFSLPMNEFEDKSEQQLITGLRKQIIGAHSDRLGEKNAIFLSGGLDSQVMAITLSKDLGLGNAIPALHFSVKNARQSELEDAKLTASTLNIPFHAVEIDAKQEIDFNELLQMNAPYIGAVSIHQLLESSGLEKYTTLFSGQDTRLHTPSLQAIDEKILGLYRFPGIRHLVSGISTLALNAKNMVNNEFESKLYRKIAFFNGTDSTNKYLGNRFFHITSLPFQDKTTINNLRDSISNELGDLDSSNKRELFNSIALRLWRRQFIYDINYMHDSTSSGHYKVAMPFYDTKLAHYSAQLPFELAAKMTTGRAGHDAKEKSVNKYLLRKAYEGELDDSLVFRDKAVCLTAHMFFNGGLTYELEGFIDADWLINNEIANSLHLAELQKLCKRKHKNWLESDHWLMMTVFNALIIYNHLRKLF